MNGSEGDLRNWVRDSLTIDEVKALDPYREFLGRVVRVTTQGRVHLQPSTETWSADDRISLFLIGKVLARIAGYIEEETAANLELSIELSMPEGTVRGRLTHLRNGRSVLSSGRGSHRINSAAIGRILNRLTSTAEKV